MEIQLNHNTVMTQNKTNYKRPTYKISRRTDVIGDLQHTPKYYVKTGSSKKKLARKYRRKHMVLNFTSRSASTMTDGCAIMTTFNCNTPPTSLAGIG